MRPSMYPAKGRPRLRSCSYGVRTSHSDWGAGGQLCPTTLRVLVLRRPAVGPLKPSLLRVVQQKDGILLLVSGRAADERAAK